RSRSSTARSTRSRRRRPRLPWRAPAPPSRSSKTERFSERGGHTLVPGVPPLSHARECSGGAHVPPLPRRLAAATSSEGRSCATPSASSRDGDEHCGLFCGARRCHLLPCVRELCHSGVVRTVWGAIGGCPGRRPGYDPAPAGRGGARMARVAVLVLAVLTALLAAAAVWLGGQGRDAQARADDREAALRAASTHAMNLLSLNHETVDADVHRILTSSTGA